MTDPYADLPTGLAHTFDLDGTLVDSSDYEDALFELAIREICGPVAVGRTWTSHTHVTAVANARRPP